MLNSHPGIKEYRDAYKILNVIYSCDTIEKLENYYNFVEKHYDYQLGNHRSAFKLAYIQKHYMLQSLTDEDRLLIDLICVGDKIYYHNHSFALVLKVDTYSIMLPHALIYKTNVSVKNGKYVYYKRDPMIDMLIISG